MQSLQIWEEMNKFVAGIEVWCNGSTTDFGSASSGSSPDISTKKEERNVSPSFYDTIHKTKQRTNFKNRQRFAGNMFVNLQKRIKFADCLQEVNNNFKNNKEMKKGLHPETYRLVAFKDMSNDTVFITRSCAETKETLVVDGVEYPVVKVEISNTSHPFYTGKVKLVDTAGRVDKFYQRYKNRQK